MRSSCSAKRELFATPKTPFAFRLVNHLLHWSARRVHYPARPSCILYAQRVVGNSNMRFEFGGALEPRLFAIHLYLTGAVRPSYQVSSSPLAFEHG